MVTPIPLGRDTSQTDRAILGIRDLVLRGEFKAGDRLTELALVEILGVSRTPIRTALQRLAEEGLLEAVQPTGYLVRGFSEADIFDAIEVRGTIEGLSARMAAERGVAPALLRDMRDCLAKIDEVLAKATLGDAHLARFSARGEPLVREHARNARKNLELVLRNTDALRHLVGAPLIRRGGT